MDSWNLFLIRVLAISIFPIILKKYKRVGNGTFDLADLSKMLFALFLYYLGGDILLRRVPFNSNDYYLLTSGLNGILTVVYIIAVLKYSPIKSNMMRIIIFPIINKRTLLYKMIILFFFLKTIGIYFGVAIVPERVLKEESLLLYTSINSPYITISVFLFITLFSAIGEELVFRYFAINALLRIYSPKGVIMLSALMWALMHQTFSLETLIFGMFLAYFYIKTGYLSICILLHSLSNIAVATGPFYIYFSNKNIIDLPPVQYVLAIFVSLIMIYHLIAFFIKKEPCEALEQT